jgi:hypothetical protein
MSNTITLSDTITFEEIATKWCQSYGHAIRPCSDGYSFVDYWSNASYCIFFHATAIFSPETRTLRIFHSDFNEVLVSIGLPIREEHSNGQN